MALSTSTLPLTNTAVFTSTGVNAITFIGFCNTDTVVRTIDVYLVPDGGSAGASTQLLKEVAIAPSDTFELYQAAEKIILGNGDTLVAKASTASVVSCIISFTPV